uniref:class II aldolase/adducin family protein n=1 Tax=Polynucleobacter sp. TaxID=2029855 RepID=UPI0040472BB0
MNLQNQPLSTASPLTDTAEGHSDEEWHIRRDLAACYHLSAKKGWGDGIYTHISATIPNEPGSYLINQFGLRFEEVTPENLVKVNAKGEIIAGLGPVNQSGFAIHGAVHAARPDAHCVLHLHVDAVIAVSAQKNGLLPLSQHALRFYQDIGYHDYQGLALSTSEQGELLKHLGSNKALLLRNHGSVVCGSSIQQAFYLMDVLNKACKIQLMAGYVDHLLFPSSEICALTFSQLIADGDQEGQIEWPAYCRLLIE